MSITNLGTADDPSGTTGFSQLTCAAAAAVGTVVVVITANSTTTLGTGVTDSQGNTYTNIASKTNATSVTGGVYTATIAGGKALSTSDTIKYTPPAAAASAMSASVVASQGALDLNVTPTSGVSTAPSISGTPAGAGDLVIGAACYALTAATAAQGAGFANPPNSIASSASVNGIVAGSIASATSGSQTYAPSLSSITLWVAFLISYLPAASTPLWGFDSVSTIASQSTKIKRAQGIRRRSGFASFPPWANSGWDLQTFQPPRLRRERAASLMTGDSGIEAVFVPFTVTPNSGWEIQISQPPFKLSRGSAASGQSEFSFFPNWFNYGWDVQSTQPPHPRPERVASFTVGDTGTEATYLFKSSLSWGWEIQSSQPSHPRPERVASFLVGDTGTEATYLFKSSLSWGWEDQSIQPTFKTNRLPALLRGDEGTQNPLIRWPNIGWEIQSPQPPHPRPERAASFLVGDTGTEAPYIFVSLTTTIWGWETQFTQPPYNSKGKPTATKGKSGFAIPPPWFNFGWDVQSTQPPHPKPERGASFLVGDTGTEAPFTFVSPITVNWGWETQFTQPRYNSTGKPAATKGKSGFAFPPIWFNFGWETQPLQPPHPRPERAASFLVGDAGIEATYIFTSGLSWGWEIQPPQPPRLRTERAGAIMLGDTGIEAPYVLVSALFWGWEIQPPQPPHPKPERGATFLRGDEGTQTPLINWLNYGWPVQPWQPPHPHPEYRAAGFLRGDEGTEAQFVRWLFAGWEVQPFQPPHRMVSQRAAGFMIGDTGIEAPYIFVPPVVVSLRLRTLMGHGL